MLGNDLFSSGNNLLLPALKMQWTVSDKPVSAFTASTPPGLQQIWAHPGMLWGGSFAMCSWTPSTVWCKSPGAVTAALPPPSLQREVPFPERAWTPVESCSRNVLGWRQGAAHSARSHPCSSDPGAAPACGDRAVSLPKGWLKINCGDGDQSWESWWEWAFIEFITVKSIFMANFHPSCGWSLRTAHRDSHQVSLPPPHCTLQPSHPLCVQMYKESCCFSGSLLFSAV